MVVDEHDVNTRLHISVLEGIVEQDDVGLAVLVATCQLCDATGALTVNGYGNIREFGLHLEGFVADVPDRGVLVSPKEAVGLALVASAEHCHLEIVLQQTDEIFHVRCLPRAAHSDVAHGDDRYVEGADFQNAHFEEHIPETDSQSVKPTQRL